MFERIKLLWDFNTFIYSVCRPFLLNIEEKSVKTRVLEIKCDYNVCSNKTSEQVVLMNKLLLSLLQAAKIDHIYKIDLW